MTPIKRVLGSWLSLLSVAAATLTAGCVGDVEDNGWADDEHIGQATFEVKQVPSGVTCIRISVVGGTTVTRDFGQMTTGAATTSLNMDRLPLGDVSISAMAFATSASATACTPNQTPLWVADAATALLEPGVVSKLDLTFRKNNPVTASVNFVGNIQALALGETHSLLLVDGQVYQWGYSTGGALTVPTLVSGLTGVTKISAGNTYSCAVTNGQIWCWGNRSSVAVTSGNPTQIAPGRPYTDVVAGYDTVCGLSGGTGYCWGLNEFGEIPGSSPPSTVPPASAASWGGTNTYRVAVGEDHTCFIASDLVMLCMGSNADGQQGRITSNPPLPGWGPSSPAVPIISVASVSSHTIALMGDGTVRAAGTNSHGELGNGTTTGMTFANGALGLVSGLNSVTAIAAGRDHGLALRSDGSVKAWGWNSDGQLGDLTRTTRTTPVGVADLPSARLIAAGRDHSCAVTDEEQVFCWGNNDEGQLGTGDKVSAVRPVPVVLP